MGYDADNRLTQTKDALGDLTTTLYDPAGNVTTSIDARGNRTTMSYDADNRVTQTQDAAGGIVTTVFDAAGNVAATVDARGNRTTYSYDVLNRLTQTQDALNDLMTTVYDADSNTIATVNGLGQRTTYAYDALNRQTSMQDALNEVTTTLYDPAGNATTTIDPRGYRTTYAYDALNRPTSVTDALNEVTTTLYDADGNTTTSIDGRGNRTTYAYDALNRETATTDPLNHTVTTAYDAVDNVTATTDAGGFTTTAAYDALNRPTAMTAADGGITTTAYDANGNATTVTDPLNHTTSYAFDALNRVTKTTDPLGGVTTTLYDLAGNNTAVVDSDGNRTTYAYDALNRLTQQTDPLNNVSTIAYNAAGEQTSTTDRLGRQVTFAYDATGRETGETWHNVGGSVQQLVTYAYDADGNQTLAADGAGAYTYAYDALDRATVVQEPFGLTLTYAYDVAGNRTTVQDSQGGTTTFVYDAANNLTSEQFGGTTPLRIDFTYTARDQIATETRYSNLAGTTVVGTTSYAYDAVGRTTNIQDRNASGTLIANYTSVYDVAGRLTSETDNGTTTSYTYDADNQLLGDGTTTNSYDHNGNRTNTGYVTSTGNEVTSDGTWTYTYDAEGNLTQKSKGASAETWTYGYDDDNRMIWAQDRSTPGGTLLQVATYTYDVNGQLLEEDATTGGTTTTTRYGYLDGNAWANLNGSNTLLTRQLFGNSQDQVLARESAGGTAAWYLTDREDSVRQITDNTGAVLDTITYSSFGQVASESSPSNGDRYKYAGGQVDSLTGLELFWHRYLDPVTMRFTSEDPLGLAPDTNEYRYVHNGPTDATDLMGLEDKKDEQVAQGLMALSQGFMGAGGMANPAAGINQAAAAHTEQQLKEQAQKAKEYYTKADELIIAGLKEKKTEKEIIENTMAKIGPAPKGVVAITRDMIPGRIRLLVFSALLRKMEADKAAAAKVPAPLHYYGNLDPVKSEENRKSYEAMVKEQEDRIKYQAFFERTHYAAMPFGPVNSDIIDAAASIYAREDRQRWLAMSDGERILLQLIPVVAMYLAPAAIEWVAAAPGAFPNCFPADTLVATEDGPRPIQEVRAADRVWAFDHVASEWKLCRVIETFRHEHDGHVVAATVAGEVIQSTGHHPFWVVWGEGLGQRPYPEHVPDNPAAYRGEGRWVDAIDLRIGDVLLLRSGRQAAITKLVVQHGRLPVYNFQVEELHCYAVGRSQILVHNNSGDKLPDNLLGNNAKLGSGKGVNTDLPGGQPAADELFNNLTGGKWSVDPKTGDLVGENGVRLRLGRDLRPRVDIPAHDAVPPETIHFDP